MKFGSRKGWKSLVPFRVNKRPTTRSCLFPKVKRASQTPGYAPVYLNVYDLTPVNGYICWAGIGVFHSGVEGMLSSSSGKFNSQHKSQQTSLSAQDVHR